jgi:hypothetical protein
VLIYDVETWDGGEQLKRTSAYETFRERLFCDGLSVPQVLLSKSMSAASIKAKIAMARKIGWDDAEILRIALANEWGPNRRREIVVEWAEYLGLEPTQALRIAQSAHLIPTSAPPRVEKEKPLPETQESTPE